MKTLRVFLAQLLLAIFVMVLLPRESVERFAGEDFAVAAAVVRHYGSVDPGARPPPSPIAISSLTEVAPHAVVIRLIYIPARRPDFSVQFGLLA